MCLCRFRYLRDATGHQQAEAGRSSHWQRNGGRGLQSTHWRRVPDVKSSVMKLTVIVLLSSQES